MQSSHIASRRSTGPAQRPATTCNGTGGPVAAPGGPTEGMTLGQFSGQGQGTDQITLSTLHSSKGREFRVVFLFGMDQEVIPWNNVGEVALRESRPLFYVGFTRAEEELHIMYSNHRPSQFVVEVSERLGVT